MEIKDIPKPKLYASMGAEVREIRNNAPNYLAALVEPLHEKGVFHDIQSLEDIQPTGIEVLEGGVNSACYWITEPNSAVALKIQKGGVSSEVEWLEAFHDAGVRVPAVLDHGVIPGEEGKARPTRYIALEGLVDDEGVRVKSARSFIDNPSLTNAISEQMGIELAKIHTLDSDKPFGSYADQEVGPITFNLWKAYLTDQINAIQLEVLGFASAKHSEIIRALDSISFPERGVYLHGDFNPHNVMMISANQDPPQLAIIDPSPIIGDPYYDLGNVCYFDDLINAKIKLGVIGDGNPKIWWQDGQIDVTRLLKAYFEGSESELDPRRLAANQIAAMLRSFARRPTNAADDGLSDKQKKQREIDFKLRMQVLNEKIDIVTSR